MWANEYSDKDIYCVVVELDGDKETPIYEYSVSESGMDLYTYEDNKLWSAKEEKTVDPVEHIPISHGDDTLHITSHLFNLTHSMRNNMLSVFFLDIYPSDIPTKVPP